VRGKGLIAALELVSNKTTGASFEKGAAGAAAQKACEANGLILRAVAGNALALCPPIIITKEEVDEMLKRMKAGVDTAYQELKDRGLIAG
jgi:4-aminobutyrate--pyruvate transaminase